jgi:hypothetical protein
MALKDWFEPSKDPVKVYRRELFAAVREANPARLQAVLQTNIDEPAALNEALAKAVSSDRVKLAEMILNAPGSRTIDSGALRQVLSGDRKDMFRLLADYGVSFSGCLTGENSAHYVNKLSALQKDYECDRLRAEVAALKAEVTALKRAQGLPVEPEAAPEPKRELKKFDL